jgi:hypothetical protein
VRTYFGLKRAPEQLLPVSPVDLARLDPELAGKLLQTIDQYDQRNAQYDKRAQILSVLFAAFMVAAAVVFVWLDHPYFGIGTLVSQALGFATKVIQQRR